jgi:hypothetical protein
VGFNRAKPHERVAPYVVFHIVLEVMYVGHSGDRCIYVGFLKERHVHLKKNVDLGCTT